MFLNHCCTNFKPFDTWFLFDQAGFYKRKLLIGVCPICDKDIIELVETRKFDNKVFYKQESGTTTTSRIDYYRSQIDYTSKDAKIRKGRPTGWICGDNREIKNPRGKVIEIRQYQQDFYNQTKLIKSIPVLG